MNKNNVAIAMKWSLIAEVAAKAITPVTNAILARILIPEVFGLVATINMVISFTNVFTDAGFQKYIIQHEFKDKNDENESINVAFWSNLIVSVFLFFVVLFFKNQIVTLVSSSDPNSLSSAFTGTKEFGWGIAIATLTLPITAFSSIQMAVYKRSMDFKSLFFVRLAGSLIPLFVTIPLAYFTRSFWSLVIGSLAGELSNAIILSLFSKWRPSFSFNSRKFFEMLSFCYWILIESVLIWLTSYIGTFIVGKFLSTYYLGIYKTSETTVAHLVTMITFSTNAVLFPSISRLQNNRDEMCNFFIDFMKMVAMIIIPMGFGMYLYSDCITDILLGSQWTEAIPFIGLWGLCNAFGLILASYWDSLFNAVGKPKYSAITQFLYLVVLVVLLYYGASQGYEVLYKLRCLSRLIYIVIELTAVWIVFRIRIIKVVKLILPSILCSVPMIGASLLLRRFVGGGTVLQLFQIAVCGIVYLTTALVYPSTRRDIISILTMMKIPLPERFKKYAKSEKKQEG